MEDELIEVPAQISELRGRIAWICQGLRAAAIVYPFWVLDLVVSYWTDAERVADVYGRLLHTDLSGVAAWQRWACLGVDLTLWGLVAVACYCAWRLFSGYLVGSILTVSAALWMRRVAVLGVAAQVLSLLARPLMTAILTLHLPAGSRHVALHIQPSDLLTLILLVSLLALAHVQKAGAEIAAEHARIV